MNSNSRETLRQIEQNDERELQIGYSDFVGYFKSSNASDYSRLGAAIGNNTHLETLTVALDEDEDDSLDVANEAFFDGLRRNSFINDLALHCNGHILVGGVGHEVLKSYQKNNNNLTRLDIEHAVLDNGGGNAITETLRFCTNIKTINLACNNITDEQLLPIVEAIKGGCNTSLQMLSLYGNMIGNAGCHAIATLIGDPNSNLQILNLRTNQIGKEGATAIANSLANNTKLNTLNLAGNPFDPSVVSIFCTELCNASSVNDTYSSNHTLENLFLSDEQLGQHANLLSFVQTVNSDANKSRVAIKKILEYHPNIDMSPLFEWDAEGEQTLKALPYVIDWFERAPAAFVGGARYDFEEKKLTAIFNFAKAVPILFVPASHGNGNDKKRKREVVVKGQEKEA